MDRLERVANALAALAQKECERRSLLEEKTGWQAERESLISRFEAEKAELAERAERFRALSEMTHWAELSSGHAISIGDEVRYMLRTYRCITAHSKALIRSPLDATYWERVD